MANITISVETPRSTFFDTARSRQLIQEEHRLFLGRSTERGASIAREVTPVGATGILRGTITGVVGEPAGAEITGSVVWPQPYGEFVDSGTGPHFPPIAPLRLWARRVLGDEDAAFPVAVAISQRGTRPQRLREQVRQRLEPEVRVLYADAVARYVRRLGER